MASIEKTIHHQLPQWQPEEKPTRTDFNDAFLAIDEALSEKANQAVLSDYAKKEDIPTLPPDGGTSAACSGNAATATQLQTPRTINGVAFDGTSNITIAAAANGGTSAACSGNAATSSSCTGNAATATRLQTKRTINGIGFDGTANISLSAASVGAVPTWASCNKNWHWSGQGGQPPWLWGGHDGTNHYVYNPSNFHVHYATYSNSANAGAHGNYHGRHVRNVVMVQNGHGWPGTTSGDIIHVYR